METGQGGDRVPEGNLTEKDYVAGMAANRLRDGANQPFRNIIRSATYPWLCCVAHNHGHGKKTLASVPVVLNLLAFALHTACELAESLWQQARRRLGARQRLFEHLRSITAYQGFPTWTALMTLLATGHSPPQPP